MRSPREEKQEEAATWMATAFKRYSERVPTDDETVAPFRTEIERYGEEFSRIVRDGVEDDLGQDLYALKANRCPALAIVELIVICTNGSRFTITGLLRGAGITDEVLRAVKQSLPRVAQVIDVLSNPSLLDLIVTFTKRLSIKVDQRRVRRSTEALPDTFRMFAEMLEEYTDPTIEAILDSEQLLLLYLLLDRYGRGLPTLSRMLKTMRVVRHTVNPAADYLHNFDSTVIPTGDRKGEKKDPFSRESLQQRLNRFYKKFPDAVLQANSRVTLYLGDAYAKQRQSGKTMHEMIMDGLKEEADSPEGDANFLGKYLKLSQEQKAEVFTILVEDQKQSANAFIAMSSSPRRTATRIFPNVFYHKDIQPKLQQMALHTEQKIRSVLNAEQREKFDRMVKTAERALERMKRKASNPQGSRDLKRGETFGMKNECCRTTRAVR